MLLITTAVSAQNPEPLADSKDFILRLKEQSQQNKTIKADFTEERYMSVLKEPQKSSGIFYYKKDNMLRWEKTAPSSYIFISADNKVKVRESDKVKDVSSVNQVISRIKDLMLTLVNGNFNDSKQFEPSYFQTAQSYIVKLKPRNKRMSNSFEYIQLSFNKKNMLLDELSFFEKSGDKNVMKFSNQRVNIPLADTLFTNF
ncbi:MAG TPA: outer membrane lipoprotein carrier protein LolA [Bacteroidia bacterium]|nr:outer membrane lipoprotein carrier protein LolA [Bacteroidota bacterium]MCB8930490.1 outer membrane lipoprotein carrier protein LolA [Bacteroidia bacterium]MCW5931277.1 outer membrane lipoprotein carrier protein LolA [Bacteroidota bacterium]HRV53559.1 outer membrane lipoprotein carrier protein LolA [Bacteroidia bacterium]